jgi:hypothetical protein
MSLFEPLKTHTILLPTILSFNSYNPATDNAPAGSKMIASASYISSIVFATKPSLTRLI